MGILGAANICKALEFGLIAVTEISQISIKSI